MNRYSLRFLFVVVLVMVSKMEQPLIRNVHFYITGGRHEYMGTKIYFCSYRVSSQEEELMMVARLYFENSLATVQWDNGNDQFIKTLIDIKNGRRDLIDELPDFIAEYVAKAGNVRAPLAYSRFAGCLCCSYKRD